MSKENAVPNNINLPKSSVPIITPEKRLSSRIKLTPKKRQQIVSIMCKILILSLCHYMSIHSLIFQILPIWFSVQRNLIS